MKKPTRLTASIIIAAMTALTSCTQSPREMLIGEYKISDITTDQKMSDEARQTWQEATENIRQTTSLNLKADGKMEQTISGVTQRGTWEIYGQEQEEGEIMKLRLIMESKATINMEIHDLTSGGFTDTEHDEKTQSTTQITYKKIN